MSTRTQRSLQALILAGLGLFLLHRIWTGTLAWYVSPRFVGLALLAAVGFLILARTVLPPWRPDGDEAEDEPMHNHEHTGAARPAWGLFWVALPLLLGLLAPARPLGALAVANKGLNAAAPLSPGGSAAPAALEVASTERTVLDWVRAFNDAADTEAFTGQAADVVGFVYHDPQAGEGRFVVSRFAVTCCSAGATAVGMLAAWPEAARLEADTWVRVRGTVQTAAYNGRPTPLIMASSVEGVDAPGQPYLYP